MTDSDRGTVYQGSSSEKTGPACPPSTSAMCQFFQTRDFRDYPVSADVQIPPEHYKGHSFKKLGIAQEAEEGTGAVPLRFEGASSKDLITLSTQS